MPNENHQTKSSSPHTSNGDPATLTPSQSQVAIIGGGWAGLACAVELCQQNHNVTLFESSPQLGGRARSIKWNNKTVDNGQHLMIGAYQQMLDLLDLMQANTNQLFKKIPHRMLMLNAKTGKTEFDLQLPTYPAPLHLLFGVLNTPSLSLKEKFLLLLRFNKLLNTKIEKDISVSEWLNKAKLPARYTKHLLEPVCLAALTTHPHQASAKAFQSVLQQTFNAPASFTDLLIPTTDLTQVFPALAEQFILQHGGSIKTRSKVQQLQCKNEHIESISVNDETLFFDEFILATPANVTAKLLSDIQLCDKICTQINQLEYEPVCTIYLQFKHPISLPYPMLGMVNGTSEWVFER
ncbi:Squalene/phytoene desaturase HopC, partial [hydrothermal vent metagenome]